MVKVMTEFNDTERESKVKQEAVRATVNIKEELTKLIADSYDQGVKDGVEIARSENERLAPIQWKQLKPPRHSGQEHMTAKKYLQILYSRLWNRKKPWVGLTIEEIASCCRESTTTQLSFYNAIEAKLKEKNT